MPVLVNAYTRRRRPVRGYVRRGEGRGLASPIRVRLRRLRDLPPELRDYVERSGTTAFIQPEVDPHLINVLREPKRRGRMENILNHEHLHITLHDLGELQASGDLDNIVGNENVGYHGFIEHRVPQGNMTRAIHAIAGIRTPPAEASQFEGRPIKKMRWEHE